MSNLHKELAALLLQAIQSGKATSQELAVAAKFLKDNGIEVTAEAARPLLDLAKELPFAQANEEADRPN